MASTLEEEFDPFAEVEMLSDHPTTDKVGKKTTTNHDDDDDAPVTQRERHSSGLTLMTSLNLNSHICTINQKLP